VLRCYEQVMYTR